MQNTNNCFSIIYKFDGIYAFSNPWVIMINCTSCYAVCEHFISPAVICFTCYIIIKMTGAHCRHWRCVSWNHQKRLNFDVLLPANGRKTKMRRVTMNERSTMLGLMYSRKSVVLRMEPWGNPIWSRCSCEDFTYRASRSWLLLRKDEIRANIWPEIQ